MSANASQITDFSIVYSTVCSGADQRKHQSSALLVFEKGLHPWPVNAPHTDPVILKMFPFDDVSVRSDKPDLQCIIALTSIAIWMKSFIIQCLAITFSEKQFANKTPSRIVCVTDSLINMSP